MKKAVAVFLAAAMLGTALTGCGGTNDAAETNDAAQKCYQKCGFTVLKKECRNGKNIRKMVLIQ